MCLRETPGWSFMRAPAPSELRADGGSEGSSAPRSAAVDVVALLTRGSVRAEGARRAQAGGGGTKQTSRAREGDRMRADSRGRAQRDCHPDPSFRAPGRPARDTGPGV